MTAVAIRLVAHLRAGHVLAARPRGVAHVYGGPLTRSGRPAGRPLCGRRFRRLTVLDGPHALGKAQQGYRVCRGCTRSMLPTPGWVRPLVSREDFIEAFGHLELEDLALAARWTRTVDETYGVGFLASYLFGPAGEHPAPAADWQQLERLIVDRRRYLANRERTPEEQAALAARREADLAETAAIRQRAIRERRIDVAIYRRDHAKYLTPAERELLAAV